MVHPSLPEVSINSKVLESQIRECWGKVVYSHKTHEKCSEILITQLQNIKLIQIILSSITTGGFAIAFFGDANWATIVGLIMSLLLLFLNAYVKDFDLGELSQKHKQTAIEIWFIREQFLSLLADLKSNISPLEKIIESRDKLNCELHEVYSKAPATNNNAYKKAQKALKYDEEMTFNDNEIDSMLPKEMRLVQP